MLYNNDYTVKRQKLTEILQSLEHSMTKKTLLSSAIQTYGFLHILPNVYVHFQYKGQI